MYQYEDPPEIQSPEQRSVVFASLANYLSFLAIIWPGQTLVEKCVKSWAQTAVELAFPTLVSFIILYLGCLRTEWPWWLRTLFLSLVSGLILAGMLAALGFFIIFSMLLLKGSC